MKKKNRVWLLMGLTGSTEGILSLKDNHIAFQAFGKGALTNGQLKSLAEQSGNEELEIKLAKNKKVEVFYCPISQVNKIIFPWYTFGGGMNLVINGTTYRFSFLQPQNTVSSYEGAEGLNAISNISEGRKVGKEWKKLLIN